MSQLPNNITELIAALEGLGKRNLNEEYDLFWSCHGVFEKLKRLSEFNPSNLKETIKALNDLPPEIKELKIEELGTEDKKPETKALNKQDLKELLEEYEKSQSENEKVIIRKKVYQRTGQENVKQFLETQRKIALKNAEKLNKLSSEIKKKVVEDLTTNRPTEEAVVEIKKQTGVEKEKIIEDLATSEQSENEKLFEIIEKASLEEDQLFEIKELKKELKNKIKDPEKVEDLIRQVEEIRAEIKVEEKAEEIAKITYEKLLEEKLPIKKDVEAKIKNEILIAWREGDAVKIPSELEEISEAKVIIKEAEKAADIFKNENLAAIVNYRSLELGKEISQDLRKNGVHDESLIREYVSVVNKLTNNPDSASVEENRGDIYNFVQSENPNKGPGEIERSIDEARFMASNVVMAPKKFNKLIQRYNILREKIGSDKLPKIKEIRVTEKMAAIFKNNPGMLRLMNGAQNMVGVWKKVGAFPGSLLSKIGVQKAGLKVLERMGGPAAVELVKNSAAIIAKEGTIQGIKTIFTAILGGGKVAAGSTAGGSVAAVVAAFQALPVVGQVIAAGVIAVVAAVAVVKPIIDGAKKLISKITGIDMNGVKHFLSDSLGLGKFVGGVGQFFFDVGAFLIGIPALLMTINIVSTITPVIIAFFAGIFLYTMLQHQQISSIVPPADLGSCILKRGSGPNGTAVDGDINCDQNAPENEVPGLRGKSAYFKTVSDWQSGKNHAEECFNDVVNRSLCAGINPLYTLWVWMHETAGSNYDHGSVQDFGINDSSIENNFDAQIKVFLRLDPASACIDDPKIGGDYWLAFATNYLTGQCDPDVGQTQTGNTGRNYLNSIDEDNPGMKTTWEWIANVPMPEDIYVEKGGQNCEQEGAPFSLTGPTKEIIGDDGQTYICSTGGGGGPSTINPGGAPVAGSRTQCPFGSYSHNGIWAMDWGADLGTPIYSTFSGIARLGEGNGYGFYIDVHSNFEGNDFFIRYAHMPPGGYRVGDGEAVEAGQQIGIVDNTGHSSGNHLHYEVVGASIDWDTAGPYFGISQDEFNSLCR